MKKLIATIALGAFVFTSTLVTTSFAADTENVDTAKSTATTAENTAETTAISAAQMGAELVPAAVVGVLMVGTAIAISADDDDAPAGHSGHE